jgi:hypothetical protein
MTKIFTFLVGQSCCSAVKSWAARRPAKDGKIFCHAPKPYALRFSISLPLIPIHCAKKHQSPSASPRPLILDAPGCFPLH